MDNSLLELNEFLEKLDRRKITLNMMFWMKGYDTPCDKICCFSPDCGSIKCSGCMKSLSSFPPKTRFQCIECEILPPEEIFNNRPEVCLECFNNSNMLHHHKKWLKINEKGLHSINIREKGFELQKTISMSEIIEIDIENTSLLCLICYDDFSTSKAVLFPGCKKKHGSAIKDKDKGLIDSGNFNHAECLIQWYKMSKRDKYIGELNMCDMCNFEKEQNSWYNLFKNFFNEFEKVDSQNKKDIVNLANELLSIDISNYSFVEHNDKVEILKEIKNKLFELHQQEWIRKIIESSMTSS